MATKITKEYTLEQLTSDSVNVLTVSTAKVNGKPYELGRERMSFSNSTTGRKQLIEKLPISYYDAVHALWGDSPTVSDP